MAEENIQNRAEPIKQALSVIDTTPVRTRGLIEVRSTEDALADRNIEKIIKKPVVIDNLSGYIRSVWSVCRDAREDITEILEECRRQRNGEYDPDILSQLELQGGSQSYHNITNHKCASAESWINEIASTDNPWSIEHTPIPEVNPDTYEQIAIEVEQVAEQYYQSGKELDKDDIVQMGEDARLEYDKTIDEMTTKSANEMTRIIEDQLLNGKWKIAFREFIHDFVTYPIGIMKFEMKNEIKTVFSEDENGQWIVATEAKLRETWKRVNPFNFYPAPAIKDVEDGDVCEKIAFTRKDLTAMIGVKGYNDQAIKNALRDFGSGGLNDWETKDFYELNYESGKSETQTGGMSSLTIDAVEFHGSVQGSMLKEWGMTSIKDELAEFDIWAILIGNYVIMAQLNPNPMGVKPYQTCSYDRDPDSIWGKGISQKVRQSQSDANQARRALLDNTSLSSGPQVMINQSLLSSSEDITAIYPFKIWKMRRGKQSEATSVNNVFRFFQPSSHTSELMQTIQFFANEADEDSGIPKVAEGSISNTSNNATSTASGLSMILDNASRNIRNVIGNVDTCIIQKQVDQIYILNMLDPNVPNSAKGDLEVRARGILSTGLRERLQVLRRDFMLMVLGNDQLTSIIGVEGIASLLREVSKPLEMSNDFIPSAEKLEQRQKQADQQQNDQMAVAQQILQIAMSKGFMEQADAESILAEVSGNGQQPQQ